MLKGRIFELEENLQLNSLPYVYIDIVKPGNHFYTVNCDREMFVHRFLARPRDEPVPAIENRRFRVFEREFSLKNSVFAAWREDPDTADKAFEFDRKLWRISKFIKDDRLYVNLQGATKQLEELLNDMKLNPKRYVHFSLFGKKAQQYDVDGKKVKTTED
mgnify:CR=1 FL=1